MEFVLHYVNAKAKNTKKEKQITMKIFRVRSLLQTSYDDNLTK